MGITVYKSVSLSEIESHHVLSESPCTLVVGRLELGGDKVHRIIGWRCLRSLIDGNICSYERSRIICCAI
jgi:hypothetical protein